MADNGVQIAAYSRRLPIAFLAAALVFSFAAGCSPTPAKKSRPPARKSRPSPPTIPQGREVVTIKSQYSGVNIRPTPSTMKAPLTTVRGGDRLGKLEERGNWLRVSFTDGYGNKRTGWVYKYLVDGYEKPGATAGDKPRPVPSKRPSQGKSPTLKKAPVPSPLGEPSSPGPVTEPPPEPEPEPVPRTPQNDNTISPL